MFYHHSLRAPRNHGAHSYLTLKNHISITQYSSTLLASLPLPKQQITKSSSFLTPFRFSGFMLYIITHPHPFNKFLPTTQPPHLLPFPSLPFPSHSYLWRPPPLLLLPPLHNLRFRQHHLLNPLRNPDPYFLRLFLLLQPHLRRIRI